MADYVDYGDTSTAQWWDPLHDAGPAPQETSSSWRAFIVIWIVTAVFGGLFGRLTGMLVYAGIATAVLTLIGVAWKPMFGVFLYTAILPIERGIAYGGVFGIGKAVGLILAVGTLVHFLSARKKLHFRNPAALALLAFSVVSIASVMWSERPAAPRTYFFTLFQTYISTVLIVSICMQAGSFLWPLRAYAGGCLAAAILVPIAGAARGFGRITLAFGKAGEIDANMFGSIMMFGFFTAVYLFRKDPIRKLKWMWAAALGLLPLLVIMTGSRTIVFAGIGALVLPALFLRAMNQRSRMLIGLLILSVVIVATAYIGLKSGMIAQDVALRLTDPTLREEAAGFRTAIIREALVYIASHPMGAGTGAFSTDFGYQVHNDFVYCLANMGLIGGVIYIALYVSLFRRVKRVNDSMLKWFARTAVAFALISGLGVTWIMTKYYWFFLAMISLLPLLEEPWHDPAEFDLGEESGASEGADYWDTTGQGV